MSWMGTALKRTDELETFVCISSGLTAIWKAHKYIYHATVDGLHAVCNKSIVVGEGEPYPSIVDRARDTMTCVRCQERVKRVGPSARAIVGEASSR